MRTSEQSWSGKRAAWGKPEREVRAAGAEDGSREETDAVLAEAFIERIRRTPRSMGIPEQLAMLRKEDVPELAARALKEGNPNYPFRDLERGADAGVPDGTGTKVTVQWASQKNIAQNSSRIFYNLTVYIMYAKKYMRFSCNSIQIIYNV